jgi:hypothetical protein
MSNFKKDRVKDHAWLKKLKTMECVVTGQSGENVVIDPSHIRYGQTGGMGLKPPDNLVLPLTHGLHTLSHSMGEIAFWRQYILRNDHLLMESLKAYAKQLYEENHEG